MNTLSVFLATTNLIFYFGKPSGRGREEVVICKYRAKVGFEENGTFIGTTHFSHAFCMKIVYKDGNFKAGFSFGAICSIKFLWKI